MSRGILIMGESGSGKTTSCEKLNPAETYYIDCDMKGLSWRGWKKKYNSESKNYLMTSDQNIIISAMKGISQTRPEVKNIVIDTLNGIMVDDEFRRMKDRGFDKWQDLAAAVYGICSLSNMLRDDLNVICTCHIQNDIDDISGDKIIHPLTNGKKLNKIKLESKFTTVIWCRKTENGHKFTTSFINTVAKAPKGSMPEEMDNDITKVIELLNIYEYGEEE